MARRSSTPEAPAQEPTPTPEVEDQSTEGTQPEAEKPEPEVDLTAFQQVVAESFKDDGRDTTTGELPVAAIEPVNAEYRKLDGTKAKNKAKSWLEDQMKLALMGEGEYESSGPNLPDARSFVQIKDALTAAKSGGSRESTPADPAAAWVNRQASLTLATLIVGADRPEVEGDRDLGAEAQTLADSLVEQVNAYRTWAANEAEDKGDAPEVSPVVKQALKLSTGKAAGRTGGGNGGVRRDVGKHIASAFAGVESGTFLSVAAIAKHKSDEYGDDHPSQGAVQARLFPSSGKCTVEGIVPQDRTDDTPRGAVKA